MKYLTLLLLIILQTPMTAEEQTAAEITQHGITWTFDKAYPFGQFCNGDYWVVGPITITNISNTYHTHGFDPVPGTDGSMLNPGTGGTQGYDSRIGSYRAALNAGIKDGKFISADNPLSIPVNSSLVSSVSWLYRSKDDKEPGCPKFNGGTKAPRPITRVAAVLTVLDKAVEEGSFRPGYCSAAKGVRFNVKQLQSDLLPKLKPVETTPNLKGIISGTQKPWIEHIHQYIGAMNHPSENMPEYGRELSIALGGAALALLLDWEQIPDAPDKQRLLINFIQIGIDFASIADNGGSWPSNGGHLMGRKWPIMFAGLLLNDEHMKNVGQWETAFQEDYDTFYISQKEIDMTHSKSWKPDKRAEKLAYEAKHLGMPEWGIRHRKDPWADNLHWKATYRPINNMAYPGFTLAAHIMGQRKSWNHEALFDYVDRHIALAEIHPHKKPGHHLYYTYGSSFIAHMWKAYRHKYGCVWKPDTLDYYAPGKQVCEGCEHNCLQETKEPK